MKSFQIENTCKICYEKKIVAKPEFKKKISVLITLMVQKHSHLEKKLSHKIIIKKVEQEKRRTHSARESKANPIKIRMLFFSLRPARTFAHKYAHIQNGGGTHIHMYCTLHTDTPFDVGNRELLSLLSLMLLRFLDFAFSLNSLCGGNSLVNV